MAGHSIVAMGKATVTNHHQSKPIVLAAHEDVRVVEANLVVSPLHVATTCVINEATQPQVIAGIDKSRSRHPQQMVVPVKVDVAHMKGRTPVAFHPVGRIVDKLVTVVATQATIATHPEESVLILGDELNGVAGQTVDGGEMLAGISHANVCRTERGSQHK